MLPFRQILIAADYSENSREAFHVACSLARPNSTRMVILHALAPKFNAEDTVYSTQQTVRFKHIEPDICDYEHDREKLRIGYTPDRPLEVAYRTREGMPADAILQEAAETGSDLIVMGTHGRTGLQRLITGSVAEEVLRRAQSPVLAVRQAIEVGTANSDEVVIHPTDFSECSKAALQTARELARDRGSRLMLVHVVPPEPMVYESFYIPSDLQSIRESLMAMAGDLEGTDLRHAVAIRLLQGSVAGEIVRLASEEPGRTFIVLGTHGRSGLNRALMGSVAEAVMRMAKGPVLTVKTPMAQSSPSPGEAHKGVVTGRA